MIQFNLLPDVKMEFIKAERTKRLVVSISILAGAAALAVFVLLFLSVNVIQKKSISDLDADITANTTKLQNTPNLNKILTIQNQLGVLTGLHDQKPAAARVFDYVGQVTPAAVTVGNVTTDFTANTITISGNSPSLDSVNTFVDTLKFTTFTTDKNTEPAKAFKDVVLAGFSRAGSTTTYNITMAYDPLIFDVTNVATLTVPNTVTTRSVTEQPTDLFKPTATPAGSTQ